MKEKKFLIPALVVIAALSVLAFLIKSHQLHCEHCFNLRTYSPEVIRHYILGFGPWAIVVYITLYTLNTISLLPPIGLMSLAAGFIFGPFWGSVGIMTGSFLGTTATFYISRSFGRKYVENLIKGKGKEFEEKINRNGFITILFMRLIPLFPWEVINYASGLSKIKYRDYILATMIGIFPAVIIQTFFSDRLAHFDIRDPRLFAAIAGFVVLISVPAIYLTLRKKTDLNKVGEP